MANLSDVKTPKVREEHLTNGKVAKLGTITLGLMARVETKYGSFDKWQEILAGKSDQPQLPAICDMLWMLCLNKSEVSENPDANEDDRKWEFLDAFPLTDMDGLVEYLLEILSESMPKKAKAAAGKGGAGKSAKK